MKRLLFPALALAAAVIGCDNKGIDHEGPTDISISVIPQVRTVSFGDSTLFVALVYNTNQRAVTWYVNDDPSGNDSLGNMTPLNDTSAYYHPPFIYDQVTFDSVLIKARSNADTTKFGTAVANLVHPDFVFVDSATGNDISGKGTVFHPYRTITKGLSVVTTGQTLVIGSGTYSAATGEVMPLTPPYRITLKGKGVDSTRVLAPSGTNISNPAILLRNNSTVVESLTVIGGTMNGVGITLTPNVDTLSNFELTILGCRITQCYIGVATKSNPRHSNQVMLYQSLLDSCRIGVISTQSGYALIQQNVFEAIDSAGVLVTLGSQIFLGQTTGPNLPGENSFVFNPGDGWCVINLDTSDFYAQMNQWPTTDSAAIDTLWIYDDDEDPTKGTVHFWPE